MGERSELLAAGLRKLRRDSSRAQRLPRKAPQAHEVKPRDRVPFDELEGEKEDHACEPGDGEKAPSVVVRYDQPGTASKQKQCTRNDKPIIEDGNQHYRLSKELQVAHLTG